MQQPSSAPRSGACHQPPVGNGDDRPARAGDPHAELKDIQLRLWVAVALTVPLVAMELAPHLSHAQVGLGRQASNWMGCVLGTPVVFWSGWPFFVKAAEAIKERTVSALQLTAVRTGGAWLYSVVACLAPSLFPAWMRSSDGGVAIYFQAAAAMTVFVLLSQLLELRRMASRPEAAACCQTRTACLCHGIAATAS